MVAFHHVRQVHDVLISQSGRIPKILCNASMGAPVWLVWLGSLAIWVLRNSDVGIIRHAFLDGIYGASLVGEKGSTGNE